jgi:L-iditol 2-dehydrogenase
MLALVLHGPRNLCVQSFPHPGSPRSDEVLLRVTATGICGSDLHAYQHGRIGDATLRSPLILGHEFTGVIETVGSRVKLKPGTRVAVDPAIPCGRCDRCREGNPNLCPHVRFCGLCPHHGSLREYIHMPAANCFPLPRALSDADGVMLEPLGIALHATGLAKIRKGDTVAVLGCGCIGLCLLQTARLAGAARVFVSDPLPWRQRLATKLGGKPLRSSVQPDIVFEAAWAGDAARQAIEIVRPGGRVILVGIPDDDDLLLPHATARRKGLTVLFARRMRHTYPQAIRLVATGRVDVRSMITHRFPLKDAARAFHLNAAYQDNVVKVIIERRSP